ncbi:hypothetical protein BKA63DRAFT_187560 [Paraphoma chrysanthemicola]|nr:hypothetical protein BKA63DRAFT_187560 [Paraphoma chrysanthemicola]
MLVHLAIGSVLVYSSLAALQASQDVTPPDAIITPGPNIELLRKQNNDQYIGWVQYSGFWSSQTCDFGNTYYAANGQWACCSTTRAGCANMPINCVSGSMIYSVTASPGTTLTNSRVTRACTQIWTASSDASFTVCNTASMFENDRDSNPKLNIICGVSSLNWSYYRQAPTTTTTTRSSASTPSPSPSTGSTRSSTPTPTIIPPPMPEEKSKAWIAGAVVGPLVGLALIGFGAFFFIRRRRNKSHDQHVAPASGSLPPPGATAYQQNNYPTNQQPVSPGPPQYYPPMQQNAGAVPFGTTEQKGGFYAPGPQSPVTTQGSQSPYGAPQQWQQPAGQPVYGVPSPSMSPQPQHAQTQPYIAPEARPFSSELEGSYQHGSPEVISVQPNK